METKLIYKKMSAVMKGIGAVAKSQTNTFQNYKFRGVDQFVNALYPCLVEHGVFMVPECIQESHEIREIKVGEKTRIDKHVALQMKYHFYAEDGSSVIVGPVPAEGIDSSDKATNKALSAALKYMLIQTFSIPTEDMTDSDSEHVPLVSAKEILTKTEVQGDGGSYVCKLKKYKDIQLRKIPAHELADYCTYLKSAADTEGKALSGDAKELVDNARKYLISINYYSKKE